MEDNLLPVMLNLGCGVRTHPDWVNIDWSLKLRLSRLPIVGQYLSTPDYVRIYDLRKGIPYSDNSVDVVYSSHVLEHIDKEGAAEFLKEMYRVLKPDGVMRIVVPDLQAAARNYLTALEKVSQGGSSEFDREQYEWNLIMLIDQLVRTRTGGEMASWLISHQQSPVVKNFEGTFKEIAASVSEIDRSSGLKQKLIKLLKPKDPSKTGELHRWMYDGYSLRKLLLDIGFAEVVGLDHLSSRIPGFDAFNLDMNVDSTPHQPDSVWMEGIK